MELMSIRAYAKRMGCTENNVRTAIKSGKIDKAVVRYKSGRTKGIDPELADQEWAKNLNVERIRNPTLLKKLQAVRDQPKGKDESVSVTDEDLHFDLDIQDNDDIFEAKRKAEILKAKMLEIQLAEKKGELISAEKVRRALYDFGAQVRTAVMAVPDRVVDNVLASETRNEAYLLLQDALAKSLETLAASNLKMR